MSGAVPFMTKHPCVLDNLRLCRPLAGLARQQELASGAPSPPSILGGESLTPELSLSSCSILNPALSHLFPKPSTSHCFSKPSTSNSRDPPILSTCTRMHISTPFVAMILSLLLSLEACTAHHCPHGCSGPAPPCHPSARCSSHCTQGPHPCLLTGFSYPVWRVSLVPGTPGAQGEGHSYSEARRGAPRASEGSPLSVPHEGPSLQPPLPTACGVGISTLSLLASLPNQQSHGFALGPQHGLQTVSWPGYHSFTGTFMHPLAEKRRYGSEEPPSMYAAAVPSPLGLCPYIHALHQCCLCHLPGICAAHVCVAPSPSICPLRWSL